MTPTEREVLRETLIGARWLIREPELWVQGVAIAGERRCALGAVDAVTALYQQFPEIEAARACHYLRALLNDFVSFWQDTPGRTHAEVLALFDRAIERLS